MPFGVKNGVSGFNRVLNHILRDKLWKSCLAYVDDVLVMSSTFEEHVQRLHEIFDTLEKANLTLKLAKCSFFQKSVKYLGHILSKSGLSPSPALISPIMYWPVPTNAKLVQKCLGLDAYYRTFIRNFSEIAKPLYHLTNKDEKFLWTDECQQSFDKLKLSLTTAPILSFPDFTKPFILDVDASNYAIGAVLSQLDENGKEHIIRYGSKTLNKSEVNYSATKKELLAMVYFIDHFKYYISNKKFTLRTDRSSLHLLNSFLSPQGILVL